MLKWMLAAGAAALAMTAPSAAERGSGQGGGQGSGRGGNAGGAGTGGDPMPAFGQRRADAPAFDPKDSDPLL